MTSMHLFQIPRWLLQSPPVEWATIRLHNLLIGAIKQGPLPQHVALVMDGNRRFARSKHIETVEGHNLGFEALAHVLEICYKAGVTVVTVYAFSIENFKRTRREVDGLMALAELKLAQLMQHNGLLQHYGVRIRVLGDRSLVRADLRRDIERAEATTAGHGDAVLNVCFPYTARDEITKAVRGTVEDWATPAAPAPRPARAFSPEHIENGIRSRRVSASSSAPPPSAHASPAKRAPSPYEPSSSPGVSSATTVSDAPSDADESTTLSTVATSQQPPTPPDADPNVLLEAKKPPLPLTPSVLKPSSTESQSGAPAPAYPDPETIDATTLNDHMFTAGTPPVDLLIRTSGVERLSDFLLWQVHERTEIVFLKCLWPEFNLWQFLPVLIEWQWRRRQEMADADGWGLRKTVAR